LIPDKASDECPALHPDDADAILEGDHDRIRVRLGIARQSADIGVWGCDTA
jgi:hypothetical protein